MLASSWPFLSSFPFPTAAQGLEAMSLVVIGVSRTPFDITFHRRHYLFTLKRVVGTLPRWPLLDDSK